MPRWPWASIMLLGACATCPGPAQAPTAAQTAGAQATPSASTPTGAVVPPERSTCDNPAEPLDERALALEQKSVEDFAMPGKWMTPADGGALEREVAKRPDCLSLRARLITFYGQHEWRPEHADNLLWFIEHYPDHPLLGTYGRFDDREKASSLKAEQLWDKQVETHPQNLLILHNAGWFFSVVNPTRALTLFAKGSELDPQNSRWLSLAAQVHMTQAEHGTPEVAVAEAKAAVADYRAAIQRTPRNGRGWMFANAAEAALVAQDLPSARDLATQALEPQNGGGRAIHSGHISLGKAALRAGDLPKARQHLVQACTTSLGWTAYGPDMSLAREMLDHGERQGVVAYLRACASVWKRRQDTLNQWADLIDKGETPDFDLK